MIPSIISYDTSTITITRHTKVQNAGGFSWTETTLDAITARVYQYSTRNMREVTIPEGEVKTITHGLLVDGQANIAVGHDSYDTFVYNGRTFRIVGIRYYDDSNIDNHTQADCVAS